MYSILGSIVRHFYILQFCDRSTRPLLHHRTSNFVTNTPPTLPVCRRTLVIYTFTFISFALAIQIKTMPWKNRSTTVVPEPDKDLEEKQKSPIRWAKFETQLIVEWFCTRDGNGVRVNYDLWTAENHSDAAEKMISHTGLIVKAGVTKKKTTDKMVDMIKQYKDVRHAIEQSRWSIAIGGVDVISHENRELQTGTSKTAKELIFKRCLWYYEYEEWYYDHPAVNPPAIIELEQPKCCDGQAVNNFELGCYDKDLHKGKSSPAASGRLSDQDGDEDIVQDIEDESDSSSLHPVLSQIAQEDRRAAKKQVKDVPVSSDYNIYLLINLTYDESYSNLFRNLLVYLRKRYHRQTGNVLLPIQIRNQINLLSQKLNQKNPKYHATPKINDQNAPDLILLILPKEETHNQLVKNDIRKHSLVCLKHLYKKLKFWTNVKGKRQSLTMSDKVNQLD